NYICNIDCTYDIEDHPSFVYNYNTKFCYRIGGRYFHNKLQNKFVDTINLNLTNTIKLERNSILELLEYRCSSQSLFIQDLNCIVTIGGDNNGDELDTVELYDFNYNTRKYLANMNLSRNDFAIGYNKYS